MEAILPAFYMPKWVDFHTHILDAPALDLARASTQSKEAHVVKWLVNSVDWKNWEAHSELGKKYPAVVGGLGWHPEQVIEVNKTQILGHLSRYAQELEKKKIPFLGETGLDYLYGKTDADRAKQAEVFAFFIELAKHHHKMIEVHTRHAKQESIDLLLKHEAKDVLLHWFSGNKKQTKTIIEQEWVCSVGPTILNSPHVDDFIEAMPLELLALETDSPIPFDGTPSNPSWIPRVAEKVAKLKEVTLNDVAKAQAAIFERFFHQSL